MEFSSVVDVDKLLERDAELGCGVAAIVVAAAANALRAVPRVNGSYRDGRYELYSRVNVGVTIVGQGIYVTPTIFDADEKSVAEIGERARRLLGARARGRAAAGRAHRRDLHGSRLEYLRRRRGLAAGAAAPGRGAGVRADP